MDEMIEYYDNRAELMEITYVSQPTGWVLDMVNDLRDALRGRRVLEVACGTGHWTRYAAETAAHVTGVDAAPRMLAAAEAKGLPIELRLGDAFDLAAVPGDFNAGLAMQWFSHIPRARIAEFLEGWHARVGSGGVVFMGDNVPYEGMVIQPYGKPGEVDTYELRRPADQDPYEIVKNYFDESELRAVLEPYTRDLDLTVGQYWWWLRYTLD